MFFWRVEQVITSVRGCIYLRHRTQEVEIQYVNTSDTLSTIFEYDHASENLDNVDVFIYKIGM